MYERGYQKLLGPACDPVVKTHPRPDSSFQSHRLGEAASVGFCSWDSNVFMGDCLQPHPSLAVVHIWELRVCADSSHQSIQILLKEKFNNSDNYPYISVVHQI